MNGRDPPVGGVPEAKDGGAEAGSKPRALRAAIRGFSAGWGCAGGWHLRNIKRAGDELRRRCRLLVTSRCFEKPCEYVGAQHVLQWLRGR
jgi:hypothetical protein